MVAGLLMSHRLQIHGVLQSLLGGFHDLHVIQGGANVGGTPDPSRGEWNPAVADPVAHLLLSHPTWTADLYEPLPSNAAMCASFYAGHANARVVCAALDFTWGLKTLHVRRSRSMSSLTEGHRGHGSSGEVVRVEVVPTVPLPDALKRGNGKKRWLQLDCEGHDITLVMGLREDLPDVVSFEWCLGSPESLSECSAHLTKLGYQPVFQSKWDVVWSLTGHASTTSSK